MSERQNLRYLAGTEALGEIREHGFAPEQVGTIAGASGGAKWLVLSQLDRVIATDILPALRGPVHLVGSSIGSWRFSCYAQSDPLGAIERFEYAYLNQTYSERPDRDEITNTSRDILHELLGPDGAREIVNHPVLRTHLLTVRSRHFTASETRPVLAASLLLAAGLNALSRQSLGAFFQRAVFHDARIKPPFITQQDFTSLATELTEENLADVVLASGSIPLVLNGIRDIAGSVPGNYRDGGIIDYHLDLDLSEPGRLTLYPHFFPYLVPGWFDKSISWRRARPQHTARTLVICPSDEFVSRLPNAKIPDRKDFQTMSPDLRRKVWHQVVADCRQLADELHDVLDKGRLPALVEPL